MAGAIGLRRIGRLALAALGMTLLAGCYTTSIDTVPPGAGTRITGLADGVYEKRNKDFERPSENSLLPVSVAVNDAGRTIWFCRSDNPLLPLHIDDGQLPQRQLVRLRCSSEREGSEERHKAHSQRFHGPPVPSRLAFELLDSGCEVVHCVSCLGRIGRY